MNLNHENTWTNGSKCLWRGHSVNQYRPLIPLNISSPLLGPIQTNNRAELTACLEALRALPLSQPPRIIAASKYIYDSVTACMHRWALQGRRVTNQDLWAP